ncbi:MAG: DUF1501 domain-containing protein [Rhodopirellula sp.]|nr:DUF1501 domain-containing protein [Rhodopirellula sp.]
MGIWKNCEGTTRRDCLKLGLGGFFGTGLVNALRHQGLSADSVRAIAPAAKNCILIWMDGGPTHFETFDPKPDAPAEIRGEFEPIATKLPGVHFSQHMKKLASINDRFSLIRSIRHNQGNHGAGNHYMMTGAPPRIPVGCGAFVSFHPSIGSVAAKELGKDDGLPAYFSLARMSRSGGPNFLGAKYAPFVVGDDPNSSSFRVRDVALPNGLTSDGFHNRSGLRSLVDKLPRINEEAAGDPVLALDEYYRQGFNLITSPAAQEAFDIHKEPDEVRARFGRDSFGQRCLLARRLVEAGVPFTTVYDGGWDHHSDLFGACEKRLPGWDNSVATLIEDLDERGLLESTLVIALGEFGRTPKLSTLAGQKKAGRDHWANAMSVLMAGGGTPGGVVVGATDKNGYSAVERVLSPENFVSTIHSKLGIDPDKVYYTPQGRPAHLVSDPTPIAEVMS